MHCKNLFLILLLIATGCNDVQEKAASPPSYNATAKNVAAKNSALVTALQQNTDSTSHFTNSDDNSKLQVLILPCSNGYEFGTNGFDFVPLISRELAKQNGISVLQFPYKLLMNTPYYGVYDKKYCGEILKKIDADFLVMSKFSEPSPDEQSFHNVKWGYEVKILRTKTKHQITSIGKRNLMSFKEIEKDITDQITTLAKDLKSLK